MPHQILKDAEWALPSVNEAGIDLEMLMREDPEGTIDYISVALDLLGEIEACESSLYDFLKACWNVVVPANIQFVPGMHIQAMAEHLEYVSRRDIKRLIINVPPGSTKSIICSVVWPAWEWLRNPGTRFLCCTNSPDNVTRDSVASRSLMLSDWFRMRWNHFQFTSDQNVKTYFENDKRGHRISQTVGSRVTGKKGDVIVIDDPHDANEARSPVARKGVIDWWKHSCSSRLADDKNGAVVFVGQRVHQGDIFAELMETGAWEILRIPEEFVPSKRCYVASTGWTDPRTEPGELLRPDRFGHEEISQRKALMPIDYSTQHQQDPIPEGGAAFKEEWFQYYGQDGMYYIVPSPGGRYTTKLADLSLFLAVDTAQSMKTSSDFTVIMVAGKTKRGDLLLIDVERFKTSEIDIYPRIARTSTKWVTNTMVIGARSSRAVIDMSYRSGMSVIEMPENLDKYERSLEARIMCKAGQVYLPTKRSWVNDFLNECLAFTPEQTHEHDDQVDCLSHLCKFASDMSAQGSAVPEFFSF